MCARECWGRGGRGFMMLYSWGVWAAGLGIVWMVGLRAREVGCSKTWQTGWVGGVGECNIALWLQKPAKNQQET